MKPLLQYELWFYTMTSLDALNSNDANNICILLWKWLGMYRSVFSNETDNVSFLVQCVGIIKNVNKIYEIRSIFSSMHILNKQIHIHSYMR